MTVYLEPLRSKMIHETEWFLEENLRPCEPRTVGELISSRPPNCASDVGNGANIVAIVLQQAGGGKVRHGKLPL